MFLNYDLDFSEGEKKRKKSCNHVLGRSTTTILTKNHSGRFKIEKDRS